MNPIITYELIKDNIGEETTDIYLGSVIPDDYINMHIRIWNNKLGQDSINSVNNAVMNIEFERYEDSSYFNLTTVSVNHQEFESPQIIDNKAVIHIGTISGQANSGALSDIDNYKEVKIKVGPIPSNSIEGVKNMFINVFSQ